jgi:hypothetical protein
MGHRHYDPAAGVLGRRAEQSNDFLLGHALQPSFPPQVTHHTQSRFVVAIQGRGLPCLGLEGHVRAHVII